MPAIDRIQQVLASCAAPGSFATRRSVPADDLQLDIVDFGPIPLPLVPSTARQLVEVARPARYGLRDKTLLDRRVRDTSEIGKRDIEIDTRRWRRTLDPELERIARDLGLPPGTKLRAELHNLLVYGPGQFFAPHQDSEKADGMIGSLVALLPSASSGGALVIEHHEDKVSYRGSAEQIVLVAFYADCRHEVRPVTRGYRAALTYNLFVEGAARSHVAAAARPLDALVELVREHFATVPPVLDPRWPPPSAPERLVYLLDHEYTQKGLSWRRLKNGDASRAELLREVAERLDCEIVLALADVHETWSCEGDWDYAGFGWRRGWQESDEDSDENGNDYSLIELCDSNVELRHWMLPSDRRVQPISDDVSGDEICFTKPSADLQPFKSEHEGYTGNAGNTVDRWYHRAAVLLWPRARTFAIRAKAAPAWALRQLAKSLERNQLDPARQHARELRPFWTRVARQEQAAGFTDQLLHVAAEIDDATLAAMLLEPMSAAALTHKTAARWLDLLSRYGAPWCSQVFDRWNARDERGAHEPRLAWLASLPAASAPLCARGGEGAIEWTRRIAHAQWAWLDARIDSWLEPPRSSHSTKIIENLGRPIVGLLASAAIVDDRVLQAKIVERLTAEHDYPIIGAMAVLRAGRRHGGRVRGLAALYDDCMHRLTALTATAPRAPGNWAIAAQLGCTCELCIRLDCFLRAANEQQFEWRLAQNRRAHVHEAITACDLPVAHVTRRVGSPYTLVLTKTRALFTNEETERATWTRDLAWLREHETYE
ncbi:MAG TPA: 2OG-Fe(II) oxygenase [Kofleriaceae bacterium]|jgi:hypothetical protein